MRKWNRPLKRKGFTLIELLVVIAIISLLVSILLPSLQKAKQLTRQVLCLTRLRSIASAYFLYQGEFDGRGPVGFTYGNNASWNGVRTGVFADLPNPYIKWFGWYCGRSKDKLDNPCWALGEYLDRRGGDVLTDGGPTVSPVACPNAEGYDAHQAGYSVNEWLGYDTFLGDYVDMPASTPMLMDGWGPIPNSFSYLAFPRLYLFGSWDLTGHNFAIISDYPHEGSANFLFFDGHAENQQALETLDDYLNLWTWKGF